jgi:hypothetical protein
MNRPPKRIAVKLPSKLHRFDALQWETGGRRRVSECFRARYLEIRSRQKLTQFLFRHRIGPEILRGLDTVAGDAVVNDTNGRMESIPSL